MFQKWSMGRIGDVKAVKKNKKVLYHFGMFIIIINLKNEMFKPMRDDAPRELVARPIAPHSMAMARGKRKVMDHATSSRGATSPHIG